MIVQIQVSVSQLRRKGRSVPESLRQVGLFPSIIISSSSKGSRFASCKLCSSTFSVSHGGINDIKRHVDGLKHQQKLKESQASAGIANYFGEFREPSLAQAQKVLSAELMMSQFIAMHNLPFQAADHLTDIISVMFPDSKIASAYACKHTKTKAIICDALDPYLKKPDVDLCKSVPFNLLCDESNELGDSEKLLTILLRAFEPHTSMVVTRHLDTVGITDFTANGIFLSLNQTLDKYRLSFDNLVSFTSDTCNVMKGARGGVIAKLRQEQPEVIDVYCICHVVNLCVKAAIKVIPVNPLDPTDEFTRHFGSLHLWKPFQAQRGSKTLPVCPNCKITGTFRKKWPFFGAPLL